MSEVVLDASALLAVLHRERGSEVVEPLLGAAVIGAVNLAEVLAKLVDRGVPEDAAWSAVAGLGLHTVALDAVQVRATARLCTLTRRHELSLGDRACLALAECLRLPVLTADRSWAALGLSLDIRVIR
ncbi:PIN domain-containing protein [Benzoatithermus flavus]|uniref:Ribonuclease VapC n=1 Tax=Benzoatithermus flavus TaxID=3108223 RepID=A0ABU8XTU8_9PROT